jgi:hypothetical protein
MEYNYKIIRSSIDHNVMEVEFSAPDHETLVVGMPLPVEGQSYLDIIRSYAPVQHWVRSKQVIVDVPVGETGTLTDAPPAIPVVSAAPPDLTIEQITQMLTPPPAP